MITDLGSKSLGSINIGLAAAIPALTSAAGYLTGLQAQLVQQIAANLDLQVTIPDPLVMLGQLIDAVNALLATIETMLADALANLVHVNADYNADLAALVSLSLSLELLLSTFAAALSAGGVHVYSYDGQVGNLAGDLGTATDGGLPGGLGPLGHANALILITESPGTWSALSTLLATS